MFKPMRLDKITKRVSVVKRVLRTGAVDKQVNV